VSSEFESQIYGYDPEVGEISSFADPIINYMRGLGCFGFGCTAELYMKSSW
jgi:hypothetical protein